MRIPLFVMLLFAIGCDQEMPEQKLPDPKTPESTLESYYSNYFSGNLWEAYALISDKDKEIYQFDAYYKDAFYKTNTLSPVISERINYRFMGVTSSSEGHLLMAEITEIDVSRVDDDMYRKGQDPGYKKDRDAKISEYISRTYKTPSEVPATSTIVNHQLIAENGEWRIFFDFDRRWKEQREAWAIEEKQREDDAKKDVDRYVRSSLVKAETMLDLQVPGAVEVYKSILELMPDSAEAKRGLKKAQAAETQ